MKTQIPPPIRSNKFKEDKIYVTFYVTNDDNLQWNYNLRKLWDDLNRGRIPIAWTISPYLIEVAPIIALYYIKTASENDIFISRPSGDWYPIFNPQKTNLKIIEILGYTDSTAEEYIKIAIP